MSFGLRHLALCLAITASRATTSDPVVVGQTFLAGSQDPRTGSTGWSLTSHGISEKLFTVSKQDEVVGQVGKSVKKISEFVWEVTLQSGYKFSDGTDVTAQRVAACLKEINTMNSNAQSELGVINTTAVSNLVVRITTTKASHVLDASFANWAWVIYYKDSNGKFIFTGPYAVENFDSTKIDLIPNTYYPQADTRPKITIKKFASGDDIAEAAKKKEIDIGFHLPIHTVSDVKKVSGVQVVSMEVGYHYMMFHNIDRLADVRVRQAIDKAIDRTALTTALEGGKATRSLFPDFSPYFSDSSNPKGDATAAKALLDEAGWTVGSNGKRMKNGQTLSIHLVAYPHRPGLGIMQPVIAKALSDIGINVTTTLTGMDWSETQKIMTDRSFDLLMWAQHTLPNGDPIWFLNSFFHSNGASNHAKLSNSDVDQLIDKLSIQEQHQARIAATKNAQTAILDQVPVSNLVTPFWHVSLSERVANYEQWGSDYYIIRSDLKISETAPLSNAAGLVSMGFGLIFAAILTTATLF